METFEGRDCSLTVCRRGVLMKALVEGEVYSEPITFDRFQTLSTSTPEGEEGGFCVNALIKDRAPREWFFKVSTKDLRDRIYDRIIAGISASLME